jgi:hypothetical protein
MIKLDVNVEQHLQGKAEVLERLAVCSPQIPHSLSSGRFETERTPVSYSFLNSQQTDVQLAIVIIQ